MSGQYSSRLGSDGAALASVTGLPRAPVSNSAKRASSEVTLTPSGSVTRTGGSGLPGSPSNRRLDVRQLALCATCRLPMRVVG